MLLLNDIVDVFMNIRAIEMKLSISLPKLLEKSGVFG